MSSPTHAKIHPSPPPESGEQGVTASGRGLAPDEARLTDMLRRYHAVVWRTAYRMGLGSAQADDATQQAYITAARRIADIQSGKERAFLLGAVVRAARNLRRLAAHRYESCDTEGLEMTAAPSLSPDELVELKQARVLLDRLLDDLPDSTREAFVLFELEGLPLREIRELLDIPMGTLASRLRRAREKFEQGVNALRKGGGQP